MEIKERKFENQIMILTVKSCGCIEIESKIKKAIFKKIGCEDGLKLFSKAINYAMEIKK